MSTGRTFSEYWHRVGAERVALRPGVQAQPQWFRGEKWFVLHEALNDQYYRVSPAAWHFIARLDARRTVEEVWHESLALDADDAPGQEEVIHLLAQLYHASFLRGEIAADSAALFQRYRRRRQRETRSIFANLLFPQIPLFDPEPVLRRLAPIARAIFSRAGVVLWLIVIAWAVKLACGHAAEFADQTANVLAPGNLVALYTALVLVKAIHESGHALACKRFGGAVHRIGIALFFFTPVPFVDATASWSFRSRWQRIAVSAAGMWFELFTAALAVFAWVGSVPGVVHAVAFNVIFLASVTTLLFNANPLLRYDGYYILSDLLEAPNLGQRSSAMLLHLVKRSLLGVTHSVSPAHSIGEAWILALYGVASAIYRTALCAGIIWLISGKWLLLGLVMAAGCVIFWLLMPLQRASAFLLHSPQLARCRPRALSVSFGLAAVIVATLCLVPVPAHFRAPGVLQAERFTEVIADAPGIIAEPPVKSGTPVRKGQLLARLKNPELTLQLAAAQAEYAETIARKERALDQAAAELKPLQLQIDAVAKEVTRLHDAIAALDIKAPHDGIWFAPHLDQADGQWLLRGQSAGMVIAPSAWNFRAVIPQNESRSLFDHPPRRAEVRLPGAAGEPLAVSTLDILPAQQQILPSPALGWRGGGSIAVTTDADGLHAAEPFFEARATLAAADPALLQHGRTGFIRFSLPPSPVAVQLWRRLGQLFQQRGILE